MTGVLFPAPQNERVTAMKSYALDTNCFIDAYNPASASHQAVRQILDAWSSGKIALSVSLHTLSELVKDDQATTLAKSLPVLPHYPIGQWDQQVTTWDKLAGTWGDAKRNEALQQQLKSLANASVEIRDRGGFIDALANKLDGFVTSDKGLVGDGPASRINGTFDTKVITPGELAGSLQMF